MEVQPDNYMSTQACRRQLHWQISLSPNTGTLFLHLILTLSCGHPSRQGLSSKLEVLWSQISGLGIWPKASPKTFGITQRLPPLSHSWWPAWLKPCEEGQEGRQRWQKTPTFLPLSPVPAFLSSLGHLICNLTSITRHHSKQFKNPWPPRGFIIQKLLQVFSYPNSLPEVDRPFKKRNTSYFGLVFPNYWFSRI